jgi:cobalt/nickel transport system ATP-binding protein
MEVSPIIDIERLSFGYSENRMIFYNAYFRLFRGQKVGLVGPNGAGKTTFFHLIMGLLRPLSGDIKVLGRLRNSEDDFAEVREKIGLLFQDSDDQLFCPTVEEDIAFGPLNLGRSPEEAKAIVKEVCERLGLKGYEKRITYKLSGGEKRLVALATVMAMNPLCYLLDEPTSGLDEKAEENLIMYLKKYSETYIIISHDRDVLRKTVDIVYKIEEGKIVPI